MLIYRKQWEPAQTCDMTLSTWRFSNILVSKVQMIIKLFVQSCPHLHGTRRRVAIVYIDKNYLNLVVWYS